MTDEYATQRAAGASKKDAATTAVIADLLNKLDAARVDLAALREQVARLTAPPDASDLEMAMKAVYGPIGPPIIPERPAHRVALAIAQARRQGDKQGAERIWRAAVDICRQAVVITEQQIEDRVSRAKMTAKAVEALLSDPPDEPTPSA